MNERPPQKRKAVSTSSRVARDAWLGTPSRVRNPTAYCARGRRQVSNARARSQVGLGNELLEEWTGDADGQNESYLPGYTTRLIRFSKAGPDWAISPWLKGRPLLSAMGDCVRRWQGLWKRPSTGLEIIPVVDLRAMPSATVRDEVIQQFWNMFLDATSHTPLSSVDGVYLILHGAMVAESIDDVRAWY